MVLLLLKILGFHLPLGNDHLTCRGGYGFFLKKYSDFGGGKKKKSDSEFLSYNLMLNSGKKIRALRDKKINILTFVLSEKKILNETKNHTPPLQVKWSVP
jgi:hypothetical protein